MINQVKRFVKGEDGQGMTEYGLILGVIAVGAIAAFMTFGETLVEKINTLKSTVFQEDSTL